MGSPHRHEGIPRPYRGWAYIVCGRNRLADKDAGMVRMAASHSFTVLSVGIVHVG